MGTGPIKIEVDDRNVLDLLAGLEARGHDWQPAMAEVAGLMMRAVEDNFEQSGHPRWLDLADSTKRAREKEGSWPGKILQISGQLAASVQPYHDALTALVGTNKAYAAAHQFGADIHHKSRTTTVRHRYDAKGNLAGFAKASHKRVIERDAHVPAHTVHIPARPFLTLTPEDTQGIADILLRYLAGS